MSKSRIIHPSDQKPHQTNLFTPNRFNPYPTIQNNVEGIRRVLYEREGPIGLDLEYKEVKKDVYVPTVLGISAPDLCGAVAYTGTLAREVVEVAKKSRRLLVGHNVVGADRPVLNDATGIVTELFDWGDSMLTHFLCNQDFSKSTYKEEEEGDSGSLGFMGLWTAASMVTNVPNWKYCRQRSCLHENCPTHDIYGYCGLDSWAGLMIYNANIKELQEFGVKDGVVADMMEIAELCHIMQERGIRVNRELVKELNAAIKKSKDSIFEYEMVGKEKHFKNFNPNAPAQVQEWFAKHKIYLEKTDKRHIILELEKAANHYDCRSIDEFIESDIPKSEVHQSLIDLYHYKESGKGLDPWFAEKYFGSDGLLHPRWFVTGASSGRKACSKPNLMNQPKRGEWAKNIKKCIIPRSDLEKYVASDASQLELRIMLYYAGEDTSIANTIFEELVADSQGAFDRAAEYNHWTGRDVAKSIVHATSLQETLRITTDIDLKKEDVKRQIKNGSLDVRYDWKYGGGYVSFTGINLADRLFGNHNEESRAKALALRKLYTDKVPAIQKFQAKMMQHIEETGYAYIPFSGRFLRLYGTPVENAKIGVAFAMQGGGAGLIQNVELRFKRELGYIPDLQVHDELVYSIPKDWPDKKVGDFISLMYEEVPQVPGLRVPGKAKVGDNYGDMRPLII
jgi:hypothetical protein